MERLIVSKHEDRLADPELIGGGGFSRIYKLFVENEPRILKVPAIDKASPNTYASLYGRYLPTNNPDNKANPKRTQPSKEEMIEGYAQLFRDECRITCELSNEAFFRKCFGLTTAHYEDDENTSLPSIILEYIPGTTLHQAIEVWKPNFDHRINIGLQCAKVMQHIHARGWRMNDVKTHNFIVNPFNNLIEHQELLAEELKAALHETPEYIHPELLEMSFLPERGEILEKESVSTLNKIPWDVTAIDLAGITTNYMPGVRGTRLLMAPEQSEEHYSSEQTDIFGLGIMLTQISAMGAPPFELLKHTYRNGKKLSLEMRKLNRKDITKMHRDLNYSIGQLKDPRAKRLYEIVVEATAFEPDKRPSAENITQYLQSI